jgi:dTDP-4-amino-4,6-dideoxygalactose transaminase
MQITKSIPFFPYAQLFLEKEEELMAIMADVCRRGAYILQQECRDFELHLGEYMGVRHAFGVANGTDALIIGLRAAGIGEGDEVILPSHTYIASAASVQMVGATPVLAECKPDHMLDADDVRARITSRTRAIMPVQVNGRTCDMDAIGGVARDHGLLVCEDAAQALGSTFKGRAAGTFGAFGTISFYPAKMLGCFGDGGAIVTNDDDMAERIGLLRDHGRNEEGRVVAWGLNSRLDNLQAAILDFKLASFDEDVRRRREIASMYEEGLGDLEQLDLPPAPGADPLYFDVYQNYELEADRRDELKRHLADCGVGSIIQWAGTPVHQFSELGFEQALPKTDQFFERCLLTPMNTALGDDDVAHIITSIRQFYGA